MKKRILHWTVWVPPGLCAAALVLAGLFLLRPESRSLAAPMPQATLPPEGWVVCADLGIGQPPGAPVNSQLMLLCAGDDWEVRAFCLEPAKPAPAIGTGCSLDNTGVFWCGDGEQLLQLYQIQQTPAPTATPIPATATPIPSATPLPSATILPSPTAPEQPTAPAFTPAPGIAPTVFVRPNAGGPGNLLPVLALAALVSGAGLILGARFVSRRK